MKIHHLNCGTLCPYGGYAMDGETQGLKAHASLVCHCLVVETNDGLVLIDTGLGMGDVRSPERLSAFFRGVLRPRLEERETAAQQIRNLGFATTDVRHIVVTHLDFDHAGGLEDFPNAKVHVHAFEHYAAHHPEGFISERRYCARQWDDQIAWQLYSEAGENWFGFRAVRQLDGLPPEILLVPLYGHTSGHCGVAIQTDGHWLLHAGDAYFNHREIHSPHPGCPPELRLYQTMMEVNRWQRLENQDRLRDLVRRHAAEVTVFSAHDAAELYRVRSMRTLSHESEQASLAG